LNYYSPRSVTSYATCFVYNANISLFSF
jgi:hypothetical protein